jgi:hypothetical protein
MEIKLGFFKPLFDFGLAHFGTHVKSHFKTISRTKGLVSHLIPEPNQYGVSNGNPISQPRFDFK